MYVYGASNLWRANIKLKSIDPLMKGFCFHAYTPPWIGRGEAKDTEQTYHTILKDFQVSVFTAVIFHL